jgi:ABC-2 type transport system permease protein
MSDKGLIAAIKREVHRLARRPMFVTVMVAVPLLFVVFIVSLLGEGLPIKVPTAVVDLDHSEMSRSVTRSLDAQELVDVTELDLTYTDALASVRRGDIFGFFVIPADFESDVLGGRRPTVSYYSNMTYFVPGTFSYKGFKTIAVNTATEVVKLKIEAMGLGSLMGDGMIQPVTVDTHPLGNPWTNYSYYLSPSFSAALLALIIILTTIYTITIEIKEETSREWLDRAGGSIIVAVTGKLIPQTVIFSAVGVAVQALMFWVGGVPVSAGASVVTLIAAMILMVIATQGFALIICSAVPNPRFALSVGSLFGILTFSFAGFSFPVESLYGALGVFSYIVPVRYYYLIYLNDALNALPLYYSRYYFAALLVFPLISGALLWNLKRWVRRPVYIP